MRTLVIFLIAIYLFPLFVFSDVDPELCPMIMPGINENRIPNYLQPWWNNVRTGKFVLMFVDFPDGRYVNGNEKTQPFYDWQLEWVATHGELDAAGEMGLVLEPTNIQVGSKYVKASKYSWYDRWNMFFDSVGVYYGTAHPDCVSNGDTAWGSFKQYWKEASNGKFELIPSVTHPERQDYKFRTGILNDTVMINGVPVIKCFMLPKKKYGLSDTDSYFRNADDAANIASASDSMNANVIKIINTETNFNLSQFISEGGVLFVYFAGSHKKFKDYTNLSRFPGMSPLRLRDSLITSEYSTNDGFGVSAHQYGHIQFGWGHTNSGRCDIMNNGDVHDNNSPQFPNPVFRMLQGWLDPIALDSIQQMSSLQPIETSYKCGVITIYGKPAAAPDWSSGESFIVENRRRLGFDRSLVRKDVLQNYQNFKGGLLIWQYSPYYPNGPGGGGYENRIKFYSADNAPDLLQNVGNPKSFFAYLPISVTGDPSFYTFDSSKTYSGANLKTGIKIDSIDQIDYSNLNSSMKFNLKYLISLPRHYSDVVFYRDFNNHVVNYSDTVFYHIYDTTGFFNINEGTIIESALENNHFLNFRTVQAEGSLVNPILFRGAGYGSFLNYAGIGINFRDPISNSNIDSLILSNLVFQNSFQPNSFELNIISGGNNYTIQTSKIKINNISLPINFSNYGGSTMNLSDISLTNKNANFVLGNYNFYGNFLFSNASLTFNYCKPTFTGTASSLNVSSNTLVRFGDTLQLEFKNGSKLIANYTTFNTMSSFQQWKGIKLENSGQDSITNCTFTNAKSAITLINDANHSSIFRVIKGNTFNVPTGTDNKGIYGENNYKLLVEGNTFNMPQTSGGTIYYTGLHLKNNLSMGVAAAAEEDEIPISPYNINIYNNIFNNGSASIMINNYISNLIPFYITRNTFNNPAILGLLGFKISGRIKSNATSTNIPMGIHLIGGNPDLYFNTISSSKVSLHLVGGSYPNLSPNIWGNQMIWSGGKNLFYSDSSDNIQLATVGNVFTDWGNNKFIISNPANHILGWIDSSVHTYYTRDNCWISPGSTNSRVYLTRYFTQNFASVIDFNYGFNCDRTINGGEWNLDYLGNGKYDSVWVSDDNSTIPSSYNDMLYEQAGHHMDASNFISAITVYKHLIDSFPDHYKLSASVPQLYTCYEYLDTINEDNYRYTLYEDLKLYLEEKLESDDYKKQDFADAAYDVILMCEANMGEYDDAMNGYEFLSLYHPDPDIRLSASWNYEEIDALINSGSGGGEKQLQISNDKLQIEEQKQLKIRNYELGIEGQEQFREIKRIDKIIADDPVMRKMKKNFEKAYTERKDKIEKQLKEITKNDTRKTGYLKRSEELDNLKEERAKRNIFESKNRSKEELDKRRMEDLVLSTRDIRNELINDNSNVSIPVAFELYQNFPNPFNPITNISFDIPNDNSVKLIIYDMLGKEVKVLVNEFKQAGSYRISFDGTNLSSGIYFYKIEASDFIQVKKMMMVK